MLQINGSDRPNVRQLHIAYHNGDHYSSVRKQGDNSDTSANVKLLVGRHAILSVAIEF